MSSWQGKVRKTLGGCAIHAAPVGNGTAGVASTVGENVWRLQYGHVYLELRNETSQRWWVVSQVPWTTASGDQTAGAENWELDHSTGDSHM